MRLLLGRAVPAALAAFWLAACSSAPARKAPPPPASPLAKAVVRTARHFLPEEDPKGPEPRDCSDFVDRVFSANGVRLPRTSEEMSRQGRAVASSRELRMADLLFFAGSGGGHQVGHVAIYVGNGVFIHRADDGVRMESLYSDYYRKRYLRARRIID